MIVEATRLLARRLADHLDRYSVVGRQRRRHRACLPQAACPASAFGASFSARIVAISLRVVFAGLVTTLMKMAYLKLVGGVLLLWIAVKLLGPEENGKNGAGRAGRQSVARDQDRRHRRRGDEPRQRHRHRRGGGEIRSAAQLCAADVRSCRQHPADHGRRRHGHGRARPLPDRGLGRRRAARLDRRRDHRQGPAVHRQSRSRHGAHGVDGRRDLGARCSWSPPGLVRRRWLRRSAPDQIFRGSPCFACSRIGRDRTCRPLEAVGPPATWSATKAPRSTHRLAICRWWCPAPVCSSSSALISAPSSTM